MNRRLSKAIAKWESTAMAMEECEELINMLIEYNGKLSLDLQGKDVSAVGSLTGWACPRCGAGNSPFNSRCGCVPFEYKVTCGG